MSKPINNLVTVASAGTAVQFTTADTPLKSIIFHATKANTDNMFVGASDVDSTNTLPLEPGDQLEIAFQSGMEQDTPGDLKDWWVDAAVSGETVTYLAVAL
jgi:hypothetical protein|tara:strand:- start:4534 stop:4836 length:303 start_codon:yes stop_codon:yes gene_type:complete